MRKIKVLHILHSFGVGGMEKGVATLVRHASHDFEHVIFCLAKSGEAETLLPAGTRVVELNKHSGSSIRFLLRLASAIRQENPDVVHTRNWGGMDGIIAARLAGFSRIVHGEHGWGMDDPEGASRKRKLIRRVLSLGVCEFTAVSRQIETWLKEDVRVMSPVQQIYNGVDLPVYRGGSKKICLRSELGLSETSLLIGVVGRLDPIKDHASLIHAFSRVHARMPDSHLIIIGDGPERQRLESLQGDSIYFLGMRSNIPEILQSLDVFALASLNEGVSNTILEAMACGLPIVSTVVGGTPELIVNDKNGILVEPKNVAALADAILHYLSLPEKRKEHGEYNQKIIEKNFTIEAMVLGYETVWRRVYLR